MTDMLRFDYINNLPQPIFVKFSSKDSWWPVESICVRTGLMRIDVCGKLELKRFSEVIELQDGDWVCHDPDSFYVDWEDND